MPQPSFLRPQSHLPEMWKKPFLEAVCLLFAYAKACHPWCGGVSVLTLTVQGIMPGCCQGHGAPLTIVLGATVAALTEEEKHCEMFLQASPTPQWAPAAKTQMWTSWLPARGSHPGVFRPTLPGKPCSTNYQPYPGVK